MKILNQSRDTLQWTLTKLVAKGEFRSACILRTWMRRKGFKVSEVVVERTPEREKALDAIGDLYRQMKEEMR